MRIPTYSRSLLGASYVGEVQGTCKVGTRERGTEGEGRGVRTSRGLRRSWTSVSHCLHFATAALAKRGTPQLCLSVESLIDISLVEIPFRAAKHASLVEAGDAQLRDEDV